MVFRSVMFALGVAFVVSVPKTTRTDAQSPNKLAWFQLQGRVVDTDQRPVTGASVTLISPAEVRGRIFQSLNPNRPFIRSRVDAQGRYSVGFSSDDNDFLVKGDFLLLIRAPEYHCVIRPVPMERIKVDVPLDVSLERCYSATLALSDHDGNPLADATVFPASVNRVRIPWAVAKHWPLSVTDGAGNVVIAEVDERSLDGVFVTSDLGKQRVSTRLGDHGLHAQVRPARKVQGIIKSPNAEKIPEIDRIKLLVVSTAPSKHDFMEGPIDCSWETADVGPTGRLEIAALGTGELIHAVSCPVDFPYRPDQLDATDLLDDGDHPFRWLLEFKKRTKLVAYVRAAESGDPLSHIHISSFDGRLEPTFTDATGTATFYRAVENVSYFPTDTTGEYFLPDAFYKGSKKLPTNGVLELEPAELLNCSRWTGTVVDAAGKPVAGARVVYEHKLERFMSSLTVYTDSEGRFRLTKVSDGTAVKLTAIHGRFVSDTISAILPANDKMPLVLRERRTAKPSGRLVDHDGRPLQDVSVAIKRGQVFITEGFRMEELSPINLYATPVIAWTDSSGHFEFPETIEFEERLQVSVHDNDFFPFVSPYISGSEIEIGPDGTLDLGEFRPLRRPQKIAVSVSVKSPDGRPIPGAEVVIVGARTGRSRGVTDEEGRFHVLRPDGASIIAVGAAGRAVHFNHFPAGTETVTIELANEDSTLEATDDVSREEFLVAAREVFEAIETPESKSSSPYRKMLFVTALAAADPEEFIHYIEREHEADPLLLQIAALTSEHAIPQRPELFEDAVDRLPLPPLLAFSLAVTAADTTGDDGLRDDWLGEALLGLRGAPGENSKSALAGFARTLLTAGKAELASQIVSEIWDDSRQLQEILDSGERRQLVGESRTIAPALAIVDRQKASRLIGLTAREVEIPELSAEAELIWAQAHPKEFVEELQTGSPPMPADLLAGSWTSNNSRLSRLARVGIPMPRVVASRISNPRDRLQFLLFHARIAKNLEDRTRLLDQAIEAIRLCEPDVESNHYLFQYGSMMLPELRRMRDMPATRLDRLVFAALWNLPEDFDSDRLQTVLGGMAEIMALRNRNLAQVLIEPALNDRGWIFMGRQTGYGSNEALVAIARIDPKRCVEFVDDICDNEFATNPSAQIDLRSGIITTLMSEALLHD